MKIETTIMVEPVGKARARTVMTKGGKYHSYTPKKTAHTENLIRDRVMELGEYFDEKTPVRVEVIFYRERPKSLPKRVVLPTSRPDIDNYLKLLTDSLEKFIYHNDSQITTAVIKKRYGTPPRIILSMEEDNES